MSVIPHRFQFRLSLPVESRTGLPKKGAKLLGLPKSCTLADIGELDGAPAFASLRAAWNSRGLGFRLEVSGKTLPAACDLSSPAESDGLQVWIDTRNTQSVHRATRFCHHFCCLPSGGGAKKDKPSAVQLPIARSRDEAKLASPKSIPVQLEQKKDGYVLETWLAAELLNGFDPDASRQLGFYYCVRDAELGEQFLTVGREFPFAHDPSLWSTLELQS